MLQDKRIDSCIDLAIIRAYTQYNLLWDFPKALLNIVKEEIAPGCIGWYTCDSDYEKTPRRILGLKDANFQPKSPTVSIIVVFLLLGKKFNCNFYSIANEDDRIDHRSIHDDIIKFSHRVNDRIRRDKYLKSILLDLQWLRDASLGAQFSKFLNNADAELLSQEDDKYPSQLFWHELISNAHSDNCEIIGADDIKYLRTKLIDYYFPKGNISGPDSDIVNEYLSHRLNFEFQRSKYDLHRSVVMSDHITGAPKKGSDDLKFLLDEVIEQNRLIWKVRSYLLGYFQFFLQGVAQPYFFLYDPFSRTFSYRGLLPFDVFNQSSISDNDRKEIISSFKNTPRPSPNMSVLNVILPDEHIDHIDYDIVIQCAENICQPCWVGINKMIYEAKSSFFSTNIFEDLVFSETDSDQKIRGSFENNVLGILGEGIKKVPMHLSPIFFNGQTRGNLFIRFDNSKTSSHQAMIYDRYLSSSEGVLAFLGSHIDLYYNQCFSSRVSKFNIDNKIEQVMLHALPALLNAEAAGSFPISAREADTVCSNSHSGTNGREYLVFGFLKTEGYSSIYPIWSSIEMNDMDCAKGSNGAGCLWCELNDSVQSMIKNSKNSRRFPHSSVNSTLSYHNVSFYDLTKNINAHTQSHIDLKQAWFHTFSDWDEVTSTKAGVSPHKTILTWFSDLGSDQSVNDLICFWIALDILPDVCNTYRDNILSKLELSVETMQKLKQERNKEIEKIKADHQKKLSHAWAHNTGNNIRGLKGLIDLSKEKLDELLIKLNSDLKNDTNIIINTLARASSAAELSYSINQALVKMENDNTVFNIVRDGKYSLKGIFYHALLSIWLRAIFECKVHDPKFSPSIKELLGISGNENPLALNLEIRKIEKKRKLHRDRGTLTKEKEKELSRQEMLLEKKEVISDSKYNEFVSKSLNKYFDAVLLMPLNLGHFQDVSSFKKLEDMILELNWFNRVKIKIDDIFQTSNEDSAVISYACFIEILTNIFKYCGSDKKKRYFEICITMDKYGNKIFKCLSSITKAQSIKSKEVTPEGNAGNLAIKKMIPSILGNKNSTNKKFEPINESEYCIEYSLKGE